MNNQIRKRSRFNIKLLSLIFLMIFFLLSYGVDTGKTCTEGSQCRRQIPEIMRKFHRDNYPKMDYNDDSISKSAKEGPMKQIWSQIQEISISQALPQRGTSNEPASAGNVARETADDAKYVFNGIYTSNSIFTMTFPSLLMRPELVASYAEVAAKTYPRKVDNRMEPQKLSPTPTRTATKEEKDDSVKFPTNRPTLSGPPNQPVTPASTRTRIPDSDSVNVAANAPKKSLVPDPKDTKKCEKNFLECKEFSYYPSDVVEKLFLEGKINKNLFVNEVIKFDINTRLDGSGDDGLGKKQFCNFKEDIFHPEGGKNRDGEYRFIVQAPKLNITQGIRTETCVSRGDSSCGGLKTHLPSYYQLECVQKYAYKQFVTISSSGPAQEPIEIPSCCVCMYSDKK